MNSHLNRVEIITYDQLLRVAKRTLDMFETQLKGNSEVFVEEDVDLDVPF